jgi:hypothetical protein
MSTVSSRPGRPCPGRQSWWLPWTPPVRHGLGRGRLHGRSVAARLRRGPVPMVRSPARTATSRPRCPCCPCCPPGFAAARRSVRPGSALRRQGPLGRVRGVHSDRVRCPRGQGPESAAGPVRGRSGGRPCGQRTARTPQGDRRLRRAGVAAGYRNGSPARWPLLGCHQRQRARATWRSSRPRNAARASVIAGRTSARASSPGARGGQGRAGRRAASSPPPRRRPPRVRW